MGHIQTYVGEYAIRSETLYWSGKTWLRCQHCAARLTRSEAHAVMHPLRLNDPTKQGATVVRIVPKKRVPSVGARDAALGAALRAADEIRAAWSDDSEEAPGNVSRAIAKYALARAKVST